MTPSRNPEGFKIALKFWQTRKFGMGLGIADRTITSLEVSLKIHGHSKQPESQSGSTLEGLSILNIEWKYSGRLEIVESPSPQGLDFHRGSLACHLKPKAYSLVGKISPDRRPG
jgi:hypothetical protein